MRRTASTASGDLPRSASSKNLRRLWLQQAASDQPTWRSHPIGTGPFKFVEFKPNERGTVTRSSALWPTHKELLRIVIDRERIRSLDGIEDLARPERLDE